MVVIEKTKELLSYKDFLSRKEEIREILQNSLETIVEDDSFGDEEPPKSILTGMPVVDSKTIMKLSPDVEEITGIEIKSKWLKSGGYNSNEDAIDSLLNSIGKTLNENKKVEKIKT